MSTFLSPGGASSDLGASSDVVAGDVGWKTGSCWFYVFGPAGNIVMSHSAPPVRSESQTRATVSRLPGIGVVGWAESHPTLL